MKKRYTILIFLIFNVCFAQQQTVTYTVSPSVFEDTESVTLTFNGGSIDESAWGIAGNALYLWAWSFDANLTNNQDCPSNGSWTSSNETNKLTYNSGADTYSITFVPASFYNRTGIGRIGFLIKAKDATGDKKSQDILVDVGLFQVSLTTPSSITTILNAGDDLTVSATNTGGNADYVLKANAVVINSQTGISSYTYTDPNITNNKNYTLETTVGAETKTKSFSVIIDPATSFSIMPESYQDGITYNASDPTKAVLVLYAPGKDFVYVAGSFNNWEPDASYAMHRDPTRNSKFWIELTGLTSGQIETYQYWAIDKTPLINSPAIVKTADPYSTLVLSPFDDPYISAATYPNLPTYPVGQEREVTVLQTNQPEYNWQVTNFSKPKKEDLVIYEVLIRDFDADRNFQDIIDKIQYFKDLNINAIELLPIMEFEGNESWGYNTAFHMALDKFYGTEAKFKELVDLCHQNGIAVILDVALNHAFGRNPMVRLWMDDADGDGWGEPSSENPYFNQTPKHSYNVGSDFNHTNSFTKIYVKRVVKHWIETYNIDGFRWDLTKGFTQNCSSGDAGCTNSYQQDRVDILKDYADYSWSIDPDHYVIFEHLGGVTEESEWANYRIEEGKGIMLWGKMTEPYSQLTMGYNSSNDISGMGHLSRGWTGKRLVGYAESHDEERLMYKNLEYGTAGVAEDLKVSLNRMRALGAISLTIPGPKMIWHFGALGMENSVFTCNNGTVNNPDCKLDTKPQPQWINNWLGDANRSQIYNDWSRLNNLKINEPVFEGEYSIVTNTLTPKIYVWDDALASTALKNVVILANFNTTASNVIPDFPYTGAWYDLMDESGATFISVSNTTNPISIAAGGFKIYGNKGATLSVNTFNLASTVKLYPNPTLSVFQINYVTKDVAIYDVTGKLVAAFRGEYEKAYNFNISQLSDGFYVVKFNVNDTIITKRLFLK